MMFNGYKENVNQDGFVEVYLAAVTRYVLVGKQRTEQIASFGLWLNDSNDLNLASVMPENRPQCLKAALILGGENCVQIAKARGYSRVNISMESDFLVGNVPQWANKFMNDACKGLELSEISNWDEYKYAEEIKKLCASFQGMVVKLTHVSTKMEGIEKAKHMAREILPKDHKIYN